MGHGEFHRDIRRLERQRRISCAALPPHHKSKHKHTDACVINFGHRNPPLAHRRPLRMSGGGPLTSN